MRKRRGLIKFIDENHNVLTVIGVFLALAAYFSSQLVTNNSLYDNSIPVLSVGIVILLFVELWKQFPSRRDNSLELFRRLLFLLILLVIGGTMYKHPETVKFAFSGILPFTIGISPVLVPDLFRPLEAFSKKRSLFVFTLSFGLLWILGKVNETAQPEGPTNMFWLGVLLVLLATLWTSARAFGDEFRKNLQKKHSEAMLTKRR